MGSSNARYRMANLNAFAANLRGWLSGLPDGGWAGTVDDLWGRLWEAAGSPDRAPYWMVVGCGLTRELERCEHVVAAAGWRVVRRRTSRRRLVTFERLPAAEEPKGKRVRRGERYADEFRGE